MVQAAIPVLGAAMWVQCIQHILWPVAGLRYAAMGLLGGYLVLALPQIGRGTRRIVLACLGVTGLCLASGSPVSAALSGLDTALVFMGFFPAIAMIRWALERGGTLSRIEARYRDLPPQARGDSLLVVGHVIGAVVTMGAFAIVMPPADQMGELRLRTQAALVALRGVSLAVLWTPFTVGMGFAAHGFPQVPLWQAILCGMGLALIGLALSMGRGAFSGLRRIAPGLGAVAVPVLGASAVLAAVNLLSAMPAMDTIILTAPLAVLAFALIAHRAALPGLQPVLRASLNGLGNEMALFSASVAMGMALTSNPAFRAALDGLDLARLPAVMTFALLVLTAIAGGVLGLHSSVIAAVMLALTAGLGTTFGMLTCFMLVLFGWFCGAMLSMSSLSVAIVNRMFRVPVGPLVLGANLRFAIGLGAVLTAIFAMLNGIGIA